MRSTMRGYTWWGHAKFGVVLSILILSALAPGIKSEQAKEEFNETKFKELWLRVGTGDVSCASCHAPNGFDLLSRRFSGGDLFRRARGHLDREETLAISEQILAYQELHPPRELDRPLQPGGVPLPGIDAAERDLAFASYWKSINPLLFGDRITTVEQARAAFAELCAKPLEEVKVGIQMDSYSKDPLKRDFVGNPVADWIPDVGLSPETTTWLVDAYRTLRLPDGSLDLDAIQRGIESREGPPKSQLERLSRVKRMALLKLSDCEERGVPVPPTLATKAMPFDPLWAVGDFAKDAAEAESFVASLTEPELFQKGFKEGVEADFAPMAASWLWLSWTRDPSLTIVTRDRIAQTGVYMIHSLWNAGPYRYHVAYFAARKNAERARVEAGKYTLQPEINAFVNNSNFQTHLPSDAQERKAYTYLAENILRSFSLILADDLKRGLTLENPAAAQQQLSVLAAEVRPTLTAQQAKQLDQITAPTQALIASLAEKQRGYVKRTDASGKGQVPPPKE